MPATASLSGSRRLRRPSSSFSKHNVPDTVTGASQCRRQNHGRRSARRNQGDGASMASSVRSSLPSRRRPVESGSGSGSGGGQLSQPPRIPSHIKVEQDDQDHPHGTHDDDHDDLSYHDDDDDDDGRFSGDERDRYASSQMIDESDPDSPKRRRRSPRSVVTKDLHGDGAAVELVVAPRSPEEDAVDRLAKDLDNASIDVDDGNAATSLTENGVSRSAARAVARLLDNAGEALPPDVRRRREASQASRATHSGLKARPSPSSTLSKPCPRRAAPVLREPRKELADLIAAFTARDADLVRRKNACGVLKMLAGRSPRHAFSLAHTRGVLPAVGDVLRERADDDDRSSSSDDDDDDAAARREARALRRTARDEARTRAVGALRRLCGVPENRPLVVDCPGLVEAVVRVVRDDRGASRRGACDCLRELARSSEEDRAALANTEGLLEALARVVAVGVDRKAEKEEAARLRRRQRRRAERANRRAMPIRRKSFDSTAWTDDEEEEEKQKEEEEELGVEVSETQLAAATSMHDESENDKYNDKYHNDEHKRDDDTESTVDTNNQLYDGGKNPYLHGARIHIFSFCLQMAKDREVAYTLSRNAVFVKTMLEVADRVDSPAHARCVAVLAHLSRSGANAVRLVLHVRHVLPTLVSVLRRSPDDACRVRVCRTLANFAHERACRQEMANAEDLVPALRDVVRDASGNEDDARTAATSTLRSLADEPANLIPLTNAADCVATMAETATRRTEHDTTTSAAAEETMQYHACDFLATVSFWITTIATRNGHEVRSNNAHRPRLRTSGWKTWE